MTKDFLASPAYQHKQQSFTRTRSSLHSKQVHSQVTASASLNQSFSAHISVKTIMYHKMGHGRAAEKGSSPQRYTWKAQIPWSFQEEFQSSVRLLLQEFWQALRDLHSHLSLANMFLNLSFIFGKKIHKCQWRGLCAYKLLRIWTQRSFWVLPTWDVA